MSPHSFAGGLRDRASRSPSRFACDGTGLAPGRHRPSKIRLRCSRNRPTIESSKRKNQGISDGFSQSQVKIEISFYVGVRIVQIAIHDGDRFSHGARAVVHRFDKAAKAAISGSSTWRNSAR